MGRRYLRRFRCIDCGEQTERMWQTPRPLVCIPCGMIRFEVATRSARQAVERHTYACRVRLAERRQAAALTVEGTVGAASSAPPGVSRQESAAS